MTSKAQPPAFKNPHEKCVTYGHVGIFAAALLLLVTGLFIGAAITDANQKPKKCHIEATTCRDPGPYNMVDCDYAEVCN